MPSLPSLGKELEDLKRQHEKDLAEMMRREVNKLIVSLSVSQGLGTVVEVATGLERKPILVRVLEEAVAKLKSGEAK